MNAADIMTPGVITVRPDTPLEQIVAVMLENRVSGVPVMDGECIVGIVSEGDLLRRVELGSEPRRSHLAEVLSRATPLAAEYVRSHGRMAAELMTENVIAVDDTTSIAEVARILEERRIKRVPVLRDGKLVGIVSRANLLQALATRLQEERSPLFADDQRIREELLADLQTHKWGAMVGQLDVTVEAGVVNLWGVVHSQEQQMAVRVMAENTPGVKRVVDHLEDVSGTTLLVPLA